MSIIDSIASRELRTVSPVRPHPGPSLHIYIGLGRTLPRSVLGKSLAEAEEGHATCRGDICLTSILEAVHEGQGVGNEVPGVGLRRSIELCEAEKRHW